MPSAHAILWFLAAFIVLWAISLVWRGLFADSVRAKRRCPQCRRDVASGMSCCGCGYEAAKEREFRARLRNWRLVLGGMAAIPAGVATGYAGYSVFLWTHREAGDGFHTLSLWNSLAAGIGAFALVWLIWAVRGERSRGRRRCPKCWYDMGGGGLQCPECGHAVATARALYRPKRRWGAALVSLLILLFAISVQGVPRVKAGGWRAAVPTTVAIAGMTWLPRALICDPDPNIEEDWTLLGRISEERVWKWQQYWVAHRAEGWVRNGSGTRLRLGSDFLHLITTPAPLAKQALPRAARDLVSESAPVRQDAAATIENLQYYMDWGPRTAPLTNGPELVPALMRVLSNPSEPPQVTEAASTLLGQCGPAAEDAVPRLIQMIQTSGRMRAMSLAIALNNVMQGSETAKAAVIDALAGPAPTGGESLLLALTFHGAADPDSTRVIFRLLSEGADPISTVAARALARTPVQSNVAIVALLDQAESQRQQRAMYLDILRSFYEEELVPFVPRVISLLEDPAPDVRRAAVELLWTLQHSTSYRLDASAAYPIIVALKDDPDPDVVRAAQNALDSIGQLPAQRR